MLPFQKQLKRKTKYGEFAPISGVSIQGHYDAYCTPPEWLSAKQYTHMEVNPISNNAHKVCCEMLGNYRNKWGGYSFVPVDAIQKVLDILEGDNVTISEKINPQD